MNTILTNDERRAAIKSVQYGMFTAPVPDDVARAVEAAALAKLEQQEPVAWIDSQGGYNYVHWATSKNWPLGTKFYTHPAPQQADRQRVQVEPTAEMVDALITETHRTDDPVAGLRAALAAAPEAPAQADYQRVPDGYVLVPRELLEQASASLGNFVSDQGWAQADMDAMDCIDAILAATPEAPAQSDAAEAVNETNAILAGRYFELLKVVEAYEKNGVTCQTFRHFVDAPCGECNTDAPIHGDFDDCDASPDGKHSESWYANNDCDYCKTGKRDEPEAPSQADDQRVPQGWKLVPVEPTPEMWAAVNKLDDQCAAGNLDGKGCSIEQAWDCLLTAAPEAPGYCPECNRTDGNLCDWCPSLLTSPESPAKVSAYPQEGEWIAAGDYHRNVRALDVALNGDGAAERPSLVDVLSQVEQLQRELGKPVLQALVKAPASKCAQCKKEYKHSKSSSGCPKCAPGLSVTEDEFQKPIFTLSQKGEK